MEEIIYDNEKMSAVGTDSAYPLTGLFVTPQTSRNLNGKVLLSEILAKPYIPDFQTWICKPFVVHDTTVRGPCHETMLNGDLCDHGIVQQMMRLLG